MISWYSPLCIWDHYYHHQWLESHTSIECNAVVICDPEHWGWGCVHRNIGVCPIEKDENRKGLTRYFQDATPIIKGLNTTNDKKVDFSNIFLQFWLECISMSIFIQYFPLTKIVLLKVYGKGSLTKRTQWWSLRIAIFWVEAAPFSQSTGLGITKLKFCSWLFHRFSQSSHNFSASVSHLCKGRRCTYFPSYLSLNLLQGKVLSATYQSPYHCKYHFPNWASALERNRRQDQHHITQTWKRHRESIFLLVFFSGHLNNSLQPSYRLSPQQWL